jgi:hypothetical protein
MARHSDWGTTWAWMSMVRMRLLPATNVSEV